MHKILLIDVDSKILNIALGKLSTYYKNLGNEIKYIHLGLNGYKSNKQKIKINARGYNKVYASNVFTCNQKKFEIFNCNNIKIGGVGSINIHNVLKKEIENSEIDYSLWPWNEKSYGFITRGCIRKCKFCFVPKAEGNIRFVRCIDDIVRHKITIFLDNNILAYDRHKEIFKELIDKKILCQFNQGLDIRLIDKENAELLSKMRYFEKYIMAFDNIHYKKQVEKGLSILKQFKRFNTGNRIEFLIYYNAKDPIYELIYRVNWSWRNKVVPYIMLDNNINSCYYRDFLKCYTTYINKRFITGITSFIYFMNMYRTNLNVKKIINEYKQAIKKKI